MVCLSQYKTKRSNGNNSGLDVLSDIFGDVSEMSTEINITITTILETYGQLIFVAGNLNTNVFIRKSLTSRRYHL